MSKINLAIFAATLTSLASVVFYNAEAELSLEGLQRREQSLLACTEGFRKVSGLPGVVVQKIRAQGPDGADYMCEKLPRGISVYKVPASPNDAQPSPELENSPLESSRLPVVPVPDPADGGGNGPGGGGDATPHVRQQMEEQGVAPVSFS